MRLPSHFFTASITQVPGHLIAILNQPVEQSGQEDFKMHDRTEQKELDGEEDIKHHLISAMSRCDKPDELITSFNCKRFSPNSWKKDLCANCFRHMNEHKRNVVSEIGHCNSEKDDLDTCFRYSNHLSWKQTCEQHDAPEEKSIADSSEKALQKECSWVMNNSLGNDCKVKKETFIKDETSTVCNGYGMQMDEKQIQHGETQQVCNNNKTNCSNAQETRGPSQNLSEDLDAAVSRGSKSVTPGKTCIAGILKCDSAGKKLLKQNSSVTFNSNECEVIGFGGDNGSLSSDEEDSVSGDEDDASSSVLTSEEETLATLTKKNTNYNANLNNLFLLPQYEDLPSNVKKCATQLQSSGHVPSGFQNLSKPSPPRVILQPFQGKFSAEEKAAMSGLARKTAWDLAKSADNATGKVKQGKGQILEEKEVANETEEVIEISEEKECSITKVPEEKECPVTNFPRVIYSESVLNSSVTDSTSSDDDVPPPLPANPPPSPPSETEILEFIVREEVVEEVRPEPKPFVPRSSFLHGTVNVELSEECIKNAASLDEEKPEPDDTSQEDKHRFPKTVASFTLITRQAPISKEKPKVPVKPKIILGSHVRAAGRNKTPPLEEDAGKVDGDTLPQETLTEIEQKNADAKKDDTSFDSQKTDEIEDLPLDTASMPKNDEVSEDCAPMQGQSPVQTPYDSPSKEMEKPSSRGQKSSYKRPAPQPPAHGNKRTNVDAFSCCAPDVDVAESGDDNESSDSNNASVSSAGKTNEMSKKTNSRVQDDGTVSALLSKVSFSCENIGKEEPSSLTPHKKKVKFFSVKRLLRFGKSEDSAERGGNEERVNKPRLQIIHPLDLHQNGVEIISSSRGPLKTFQRSRNSECERSGSLHETDASSLKSETSSSTSSGAEQMIAQHMLTPRRKSFGDDGHILQLNQGKEIYANGGDILPAQQINFTARPLVKGEKPAPPPRPPPPKPPVLQKLAATQTESTCTMNRFDSGVYANIGEIRSAMIPSKPQRSSSLKENNHDNTVKRQAPRHPDETSGEGGSKRLVNKDGLPDPPFKLEDNYTTPVLFDLYKNFPSKYEALAHYYVSVILGMLEKMSHRCELFHGTEDSSESCYRNLCWDDFDVPGYECIVTINSKIFCHAELESTPVTLFLIPDVRKAQNRFAPNYFNMASVMSFVGAVPSYLAPLCLEENAKDLQALVQILPRHQISSLNFFIASHPKSLVSEDKYFQQVWLMLLQLIVGLKWLQAEGIEEMAASLDSIILLQNQLDPHVRVVVFKDNDQVLFRTPKRHWGRVAVKESDTLSLCETALLVMLKLLHVESARDKMHEEDLPALPHSFEPLAKVLREEKAASLSYVKSMLEYLLWGPKECLVHSNASAEENETTLQIWLDFERYVAAEKYVKNPTLSGADTTVMTEFHLRFLAHANAKRLRQTVMQF